MAMDPMDREPNVYNRETNVYDNTGRGSNTLAYVIGGLVVALGLLAFLFYDGGSNEPSTTGSTATQTERSSPSTGSTAPATPSAPSAPAAPASPSSPAAPSAPANPQ
ncbi:LPXTG cell wall anchor domain-containing protein [Microvirga mediterraneensis]|uniref:LPXTG cell wall anchor domain-containing protein n=1 Tax=Microvirga mediterraneensis TaxID=2754695 RepID=A0A838BRC0_9HYPH|nr:LPXTG cell wall anchor domain-containing protein [Microvirga mediterraneensis]MBA1157512.1 LPXTG cell wall anchor domain-containing protein [Microvirga mediterraneensis]